MNYPPNKTAELCFENPNIFSIYFDPNTTQAFIIAISAAPAITTNTKDGLQQSMYISRKTVLSLEEKQICIFYWWSYTGWNKKKKFNSFGCCAYEILFHTRHQQARQDWNVESYSFVRGCIIHCTRIRHVAGGIFGILSTNAATCMHRNKSESVNSRLFRTSYPKYSKQNIQV